MKILEEIREEFGIHFEGSKGELEWMLQDIRRALSKQFGLGMLAGSAITFLGMIIILLTK